MKGKLTVAIAVVWALEAAGMAAPVNLVRNGEFETPEISGDWGDVAPADVGWASTETRIELWAEGFSSGTSFSANGTDGLPGGQNLELGWNAPCTISQTVRVPLLADPNGTPGLNPSDRSAVLSFDWAERAGDSDVHWAVLRDSTGADIVSGSDDGKRPWTRVSSGPFDVIPGESLTVKIWNTGGSGQGSHVDQVELAVDVITVPEPAALAALALLGRLGLGRRRRR